MVLAMTRGLRRALKQIGAFVGFGLFSMVVVVVSLAVLVGGSIGIAFVVHRYWLHHFPVPAVTFILIFLVLIPLGTIGRNKRIDYFADSWLRRSPTSTSEVTSRSSVPDTADYVAEYGGSFPGDAGGA